MKTMMRTTTTSGAVIWVTADATLREDGSADVFVRGSIGVVRVAASDLREAARVIEVRCNWRRAVCYSDDLDLAHMFAEQWTRRKRTPDTEVTFLPTGEKLLRLGERPGTDDLKRWGRIVHQDASLLCVPSDQAPASGLRGQAA